MCRTHAIATTNNLTLLYSVLHEAPRCFYVPQFCHLSCWILVLRLHGGGLDGHPLHRPWRLTCTLYRRRIVRCKRTLRMRVNSRTFLIPQANLFVGVLTVLVKGPCPVIPNDVFAAGHKLMQICTHNSWYPQKHLVKLVFWARLSLKTIVFVCFDGVWLSYGFPPCAPLLWARSGHVIV